MTLRFLGALIARGATCLSLLLVVLLSASSAVAADAKPTFTAAFGAPGRVGEAVVLEVRATIPHGYHLYALTKIQGGPKPLTLGVTDARLSPLTEWFGPRPRVERDLRLQVTVEYFEDAVVHRRAFRIGPGSLDPVKVEVRVDGQICNDAQCVPFRETQAATLTVEAGAARFDRTASPTLEGEAFAPDRPAPDQGVAAMKEGDGAPVPVGDGGLWSFLLLAFAAGLGALVTPCVFPMIPITVGIFSKYAAVSARRSAIMAAVYSGSIIFCFTIIGVAVSAIFGAVGMQAISASVWFNIFLTVLLLVFSFNLFGLFEIALPDKLITGASERNQALRDKTDGVWSQVGGIFLMGVTFTLVSFTCTVGFVGVVLAQASKGNWFYPALGMLAFSFAFSIPFFWLAMFPGWAARLRGKGGDWMIAVKVILGFLEFAGAFKFLSNVDLLWGWGFVTRPFVLAVWTGVFFTAALYLLRLFALSHSEHDRPSVGPVRMMFAVFMFSLSAFSFSGIRDTASMGGWLDAWLPPAVYPGQEAAAVVGAPDHPRFIVNDLQKALEQGRAEGKPVFVDFTGLTCANCRDMEASMFPRPEVRERLSKMVLVQLYTDCLEPVCEQQQSTLLSRFETIALPYYVVMDPFDESALARFASSTGDEAAYVAFLDTGLAGYATRHNRPPPAPPAPDPALPALIQTGAAVDFKFKPLGGGPEVSLSSLRGRWVLVNFWASWCAPCLEELRSEFPKALALAPSVAFLTVAFEDDDTKAVALAKAKEFGFLDASSSLLGPAAVTDAGLPASFVSTDSLPATYLIAPDGHVAWAHTKSLTAATLTSVFAAAGIPVP